MNESQQYTPSELIYLFLDGEADGVQQSTLFAALAHDAELQGEFQEAVLVSRTLDRVRNDVHPPQDFTEGVFAAAGFTAPHFHPLPTLLAGKWSASLSAIIRHVGIPVASALIGAITVFLLMTMDRDGSGMTPVQGMAGNSTTAPGSSHNRESRVAESEAVGSMNLLDNTQDKSASHTHGAIARTQVGPETASYTRQRENTASSVLADETSVPQTVINDTPVPFTPVQSDTDSDINEPVQTIVAESVPVVEQTLLKTPVQHFDHQSSYANLQPIYNWENTVSEREPGVSLFVRGIESINSFPSRTNNIEASGSTSNVGFGCLYYYSKNQALGMEVARELLPIYNTSGDDPELNSVLVWIGGLWQVQTDFPGLRSDIQPFLRLGLGGTAYGPSGKALAGIMYTAEQRLSISLGIETTALLSWQNGKIGSTEKIAFSYGLSFHF